MARILGNVEFRLTRQDLSLHHNESKTHWQPPKTSTTEQGGARVYKYCLYITFFKYLDSCFMNEKNLI